MSLKKEYDLKRPFTVDEDKQLFTVESFARAYAIMTKHIWIKFHITQRELIENRYSLYQDRKMKDYDKCISQQVNKFSKETENIEDRAVVYLAVEENAWERSSLIFHRQSEFLHQYQEEYAKALLETWTKPVPERGMARKLIVKTFAIELMNIVKLPQVLTRSLETSIGLYLNDYYMVHDAI